MAAGDRLRVIYDGLAKDPNSLANLDQDLPNYAQVRSAAVQCFVGGVRVCEGCGGGGGSGWIRGNAGRRQPSGMDGNLRVRAAQRLHAQKAALHYAQRWLFPHPPHGLACLLLPSRCCSTACPSSACPGSGCGARHGAAASRAHR